MQLGADPGFETGGGSRRRHDETLLPALYGKLPYMFNNLRFQRHQLTHERRNLGAINRAPTSDHQAPRDHLRHGYAWATPAIVQGRL